jgi:hypothetical protein
MKMSTQIIPEGSKHGPKFPCVCGETFETAEDFGNHFSRVIGGTTINGCALSPRETKKLRKQEAAA